MGLFFLLMLLGQAYISAGQEYMPICFCQAFHQMTFLCLLNLSPWTSQGWLNLLSLPVSSLLTSALAPSIFFLAALYFSRAALAFPDASTSPRPISHSTRKAPRPTQNWFF